MLRRRFFSWIVRHRKLVLLLLMAPTIAGGAVAGKVGFDNRTENWFLDDDPSLVVYNQFLDRFQADQIVVLGVFADEIFTPRVLAKLKAITEEIEALPRVHRVRSLINARVFKAEDEDLKIAPVVRDLPKTRQDALALRRWALANTLLKETFVSADGKAAAIVVEIDRRDLHSAALHVLIGALREIADRESHNGLKLRLAGEPVVEEGFARNSQQDVKFNTPIVILVLTIIIYLFFRKVSHALIPLAVVIASICWMFGLMYVFDIKMTSVSSVLNGLVLAVGVADTIHVISEYQWRLAGGQEQEDALVHSLSHLLLPCTLTSVTTIIGLLSLLMSSLQPIREFAIFSAVGVAGAFVNSIMLAPALLRMTKPAAQTALRRQREGVFNRVLARLGRPSRKQRDISIGVASLLLLVSGLAIPQVRIGANMIRFFKEDSRVRRDTDAIDGALGGTFSLDILVETPDQGLKDPKTLRKLEQLQRWIERQPDVARVTSIVDYLKELNRVLRGDRPEAFKLPRSREVVAQYYLLFEGEREFRKLVQGNYSMGRMTVRYLQPKQPGQWLHRIGRINHRLETHLTAPIKAITTGLVKLNSRLEWYFVTSMIKSLLLALSIITVIMAFMLRSLRLALLAMVPNISPIVVGLGFMVLVGISLNPGTLMIAAIAIGLVVDDTVHFLFRLKHTVEEGATLEEGIDTTMQEAGRPIIFTSLVLAGGFVMMVLAENLAAVHFSVIITVVILFALLADLVLMPALLLVIRPRIAPAAGRRAGGK